jgi:hypothetical protein
VRIFYQAGCLWRSDTQGWEYVSEVIRIAGQQSLVALRKGADQDVRNRAFNRLMLTPELRVLMPCLVRALRVVPCPRAGVFSAYRVKKRTLPASVAEESRCEFGISDRA